MKRVPVRDIEGEGWDDLPEYILRLKATPMPTRQEIARLNRRMKAAQEKWKAAMALKADKERAEAIIENQGQLSLFDLF